MYLIKVIHLSVIFVLVVAFTSCNDFVQNVDPLIDNIDDEVLTTQEQVAFLTTGVQARFATTHDQATLLAGGLSDEEIFDTDVPNATFPTYAEIDAGVINFDNNSVDGLYIDLGELRYFADDLVRRVGEIEFTQEYEQDRIDALFYGNFLGGAARYFYAAYFGLEPAQGGGVIDGGPFIPSNEMYQLALDKLDASLQYATPYQAKVVASTKARILLYMGNYTEALSVAENGLMPGDAPFQSLHSIESTNAWFFGGGRGRAQFVANYRFNDYVQADSQETARLPLTAVVSEGSQVTDAETGQPFFFQDKYPARDTPINFISWQENHLIRAELELRVNNDEVAAKDLINEVRASHGLTEYGLLDTVDMDVIIEERDKELFTTGARLIDQRRFDLWHLPDGTWQYLPITQSERNQNENL